MRYLGLMVDTEQMVFRVPDDKLGEFLEEAEAALQERAMTGRQVRRLAGKLVSFTLAVQGAPLLFRALFHAARVRGSERLAAAGCPPPPVAQGPHMRPGKVQRADLKPAAAGRPPRRACVAP